MTLEQRLDRVRGEVAQCCLQAGRDANDVLVIGVSKTVGVDAVAQAVAAGLHDFGENRPEQLALKHDAFPNENWHFIGNIQSRQLSQVVGRACLIHSLYQQSHADKIDRLARELGIVQDVLIEVNDGETNKQGVDAKDALAMVEYCAGLPNVRVRGFMTMAPIGPAEQAAKVFASLQQLRDEVRNELAARGVALELNELSMGMSDDYRQAVPFGSTMVRIGRAIFSDEFDVPVTEH